MLKFLITRVYGREMNRARFLWVDDEMELLRPYVLFLEEKGYEVESVNNGQDAIDRCREEAFDMIFLDEHMPGLSGLETLRQISFLRPDIPVVMITNSEDEGIMEKAIGKKITDYLIKPVNPHQIIMTIKKHFDKNEIIRVANTVDYLEEFNRLSSEINACHTAEDWVSVYKKMVYWDMELSQTDNPMLDVFKTQKTEADKEFGRFVKNTYISWIEGVGAPPLLSPGLFGYAVFPLLDKREKVFFILIDNFRLDQWYAIRELIAGQFNYLEETYFSILPTATQYARNAVLSGLMPQRIRTLFPDLWTDEKVEEGKNHHEETFIRMQFKRYRRANTLICYRKINNHNEGERILRIFPELEQNDLCVLVYNFIDMLSHARTDSTMVRELASDEAAYRSITRSWFTHSSLPTLLREIAAKGYKVILTTDHGTIRVKNALQVVSDKDTNTNLRYKLGRNISYDAKKVFEIMQPERAGLPAPYISTRYIFALNDDFFVYRNNYNLYASYYANTFQHGGISMEEMIVPLITLSPK